jgi:hypothetical protein
MNTQQDLDIARANAEHDAKFHVSDFREYRFLRIRSSWNERHAVMGKKLTDHAIEKWQKSGGEAAVKIKCG